MQELLYFTEILGLKVYDLKGRSLGASRRRLVPLVDPVRVDRYLIGSGGAWLTVRHDQVRSISLDGIHLRDEILTPYHSDEYMLRVVRDLLDQQIIDAQGRKVVRVTDVTFEIRAGERRRSSVGAGRGHRPAQRFSAAWCRECCRRAGSAGCRWGFRRIPSAGSSATFWSPIRSGGCA